MGGITAYAPAIPLTQTIQFQRKQRSGHILQMSSIGGRVGTEGLGPYQTAKWGIEGFSEVLSREVAPLGIKVTLIEPGGMGPVEVACAIQLLNVSSVIPSHYGTFPFLTGTPEALREATKDIAGLTLREMQPGEVLNAETA